MIESSDPDLEEIFAGSAISGFRPARAVFATLDPSLRIVDSALLCGGVVPSALFRPSVSLEELFRPQALKKQVIAAAAAALQGDPQVLELSVQGRSGPSLVRLHLAPRFHVATSRRGLFFVAYSVRQESSPGQDLIGDRLLAILDHAADAIVIMAEDGAVEEINQAAARLFGWEATEIVGQPISVLMDEPYATLHQTYVERYVQTGASAILNVGPRPLPGRRKDGTHIPVELAISEAKIGGARKFIGAVRDISARLRQEEELRQANKALREKIDELERLGAELQEQRRRSEALAEAANSSRNAAERATLAKSKLLATVSHELRTPLNGVLAAADLLTRQDLTPEAQRLAGIIQRSGRDLVSLVTDVLDLSKLEAGALEIIAQPFSLEETIASVAEVWGVAAAAKGLDLLLEKGPIPSHVVGDRLRLIQVLGNVVSNAIKYTRVGAVTLSVNGTWRAPNEWLIHFCVTDTGPGLDDSAIERLFEPFARGMNEHTRQETGTGLGLAICSELVGLMGGRIAARNVTGGGARVEIDLSLPPATQAQEQTDAKAALSHRPRVLVAEDHPVNRTIIGLLLEELGLPYEMATDGQEAVAAAAASAFDLILMDVRMPTMDGLEATRIIRATPGPGADVPIIAVTADASASDDIEIFDAGIDGVVTKPLTLDSLASAIEAALSQPAPASGGGIEVASQGKAK